MPVAPWDLQHSHIVVEKAAAVRDEQTHADVLRALTEFSDVVVPLYSQCRRGWIHGDLNDRVRERRVPRRAAP
jgi:Ser/Thr protein kinase RdoA (MazF antagonist)